jgi:hypothetical protein
MTDARAIHLLAALRSVGRIGGRLGVRMLLAEAPAETQALVRGLLDRHPRLTWDGDWLEGALLVELGERAAHALGLARRRARRHARHAQAAARREGTA